jgi:hypothetical protein
MRLVTVGAQAPGGLCRVVLGLVKTAISIPDETFERASRRAREPGVSRSEFFATAAARYLDELDGESTTREIDLAIDALGGPDTSAQDAVGIGRRLLAGIADAW